MAEHLRRPTALVVGDVMNDIVVRPGGPLAPGGDRAATIRMRPGGSGANQAAWLAAEGVAVRFAGRVGAGDFDGHARLLAESGVDARLAVDRGLPTGAIVNISFGGERSFYTDRGANDALCGEDLPPALLDGVSHLHISGYSLFAAGPRAAVRSLMREAARRQIAISVDPASWTRLEEAGAAEFFQWTRGAAMLFPNEREAASLVGAHDVAAQLGGLLQHYRLVVLKRDEKPAIAATRDGKRCEASPPKVEIVDATGGGDAFLAGFLAAHLRGEPLQSCLAAAVLRGAAAVTIIGGRPPSNIATAHLLPSLGEGGREAAG
jgi:sugar/nucleoside kinase (ribokinase family)